MWKIIRTIKQSIAHANNSNDNKLNPGLMLKQYNI